MSHTNSTANLGLPQFIGTDKPTWLSDVNGAFAAIDSYAGSNDAALAIVDGKAATAIGDASSAVTTATNAATTAGNAAATATNANTIAGNALTVANGINSKVGVLTDLTTTDKSTVVNAINEVNGKDAADIPYDNTGSGLTATDVQAAIDEVALGGGGSALAWSTLWTNPDISQAVSAGNISVPSIQDYKMLAIEVIYTDGYPSTSKCIEVVPNLGASSVDFGILSGNIYYHRTFTTGTDVFVISGAVERNTTNFTESAAADTIAIPVKIYGIK